CRREKIACVLWWCLWRRWHWRGTCWRRARLSRHCHLASDLRFDRADSCGRRDRPVAIAVKKVTNSLSSQSFHIDCIHPLCTYGCCSSCVQTRLGLLLDAINRRKIDKHQSVSSRT